MTSRLDSGTPASAERAERLGHHVDALATTPGAAPIQAMWGPVASALGWLGFGGRPAAVPPPMAHAEHEPAWKRKAHAKKRRAKEHKRAAQEREDNRRMMIGGALAGLVATGAAVDFGARIREGPPSGARSSAPAPPTASAPEPTSTASAGWSLTGALSSLLAFPSFPMAAASPVPPVVAQNLTVPSHEPPTVHPTSFAATSAAPTTASLPPLESLMHSSALIAELHRDYVRRNTPSDPSRALQVYQPPIDLLRPSPARAAPVSVEPAEATPAVVARELGPQPTALTPKKVTPGSIDSHGGGASGASKTGSLDFGDGRVWGKTFLKNAEANANVGESTVYSSKFNSELLQQLDVVAPEIEYIDHGGHGTIASRGLADGFQDFKGRAGVPLTSQDRVSYAKLALMSPLADMHHGNFGWSGGKLGTNDVDTSAPYLTHWHSRLVDRFKLQQERYRTTDVGSNYLGQGRSQDHFLHHSVPMGAADIAAAAKDFSDIPVEQLTKMMSHYPLQGPASQKLALHSMLKQQQLFRQAFDFEADVADRTPWPQSKAHARLQKAIAEREANNEFPYHFQVSGPDMLEVRPNEQFQRPAGTEVWKDAPHAESTNPELSQAVANGHYGDAVLRMSHDTALHPNDIAALIRSAKPFTRSIGDGNPVVELVAKLINHPSFDKMSSAQQSQVRDLFASAPKLGNPLRQAFFPKHLVNEREFRSDNFHEGGKQVVKDAYERLKKIGAT